MTNIVADMCQNTFMRFKASHEYETFKKDLKDTYNKVTIEDFEYLELLGSGGFGRVVHARKKSTGKHYGERLCGPVFLTALEAYELLCVPQP
jgi:hypothetical protein